VLTTRLWQLELLVALLQLRLMQWLGRWGVQLTYHIMSVT
jgi:hypothetical protein